MVSSRKEINQSILDTTRQIASQIGGLVNDYINLTLCEINNPGWAFPRGNYNHLWSWLRRKTTFSTAEDTSDYLLGRDIDKIALIRQTTSPTRVYQVTDDQFFELVPNPTATGNPQWYRLWETHGVSTKLSAAGTIDVVSGSAADSGDSELSISVSGYDSNGIWRIETYQLNGTTKVSGSITFAAREIFVTKQKDTVGSITVTTGSTTLVVLGPDERIARFKVITLYPIPSSAITMYIEYYTTIPQLENDSDVPIFDSKWHYVVRLGGLAKTYQYLNKEVEWGTTQAQYAAAVRAMVASDRVDVDLIEQMYPRKYLNPNIWLRKSEDAIS